MGSILHSYRRLFFSGAIILVIWGGTSARKVLGLLGDTDPSHLAVVAFSSRTTIPVTENEVAALVDEAVESLLGPQGLAAVIQPGDKVVIKVNTVEPDFGAAGEKGYAIITDPRVTMAVAGRVRQVIGWSPPAELLVVDALFDRDNQPPANDRFYRCRVDADRDGTVDYRYDGNHDGILDGGSGALLVNSDAIPATSCFTTTITEPLSGPIPILLPKFLRTEAQAIAAGEPDEYCDVFINLPVFKNHMGAGMALSMKNMYGLAGNAAYDSLGWDRGVHAWTGDYLTTRDLLDEFIVAQCIARPADLVIADALTGNRSGPANLHIDWNDPADYITPNAIFAATDQVAVDTVMTLLAGYQPETVAMLGMADAQGLGVADPAWIHVRGFDAFTAFRDSLEANFPDQYPFPDPFPPPTHYLGTDEISNFTDFAVPSGVTLSGPEPVSGTDYEFPYSAEDADSGIVRVELLIDGSLVTADIGGITSPGAIACDLAPWDDPDTHEARIAVWDQRLNCTVSDPVSFTLQAPVNGWEDY
jgi:uncharacterized protein (DUF362 family)